MIRIGITGGDGFIGQHARFYALPLEKAGEVSVTVIPREAFGDTAALGLLLKECDAVFHFAGMNRGSDEEVYRTNVSLAQTLVDACVASGAKPHILLASSTHIERDSAYGRSKKEAGRILAEWGTVAGTPATALVLPHVFGEFSKPHYNSAVATFCYQLAKGEVSEVNPDSKVELLYVRDAVAVFFEAARAKRNGEIRVPSEPMALPAVYALLANFNEQYRRGVVPRFEHLLQTHLFTTLQAHLFWELFPAALEEHADARGTLFETVRHDGAGQTFFSVTKPGQVRGNHYHTRKFERFCVVGGEGEISLRKLLTDEVRTFKVSGEAPVVLDMPTYYVHNLKNAGSTDMQGVFWINEQYNPDDPDTFYEIV